MPCLIGLDSRMIRHTGIGTYVRGLLRGIQETDPSWLQEMTLFGPDGLMEGWEAANHREFDAPIYGIKEQLLYPSRLRRCKLWHAPHYNVPLVRSGAKLVVTIHDLQQSIGSRT